MEDDNRSIDSPAQNTLEATYLSNPGTPRNEKSSEDIGCISSTSSYPLLQGNMSSNIGGGASRQQQKPKYSQLLAIIEELGKDIRPTYAGSRSSAERLKRGIVHARILVRECLMETERNARS